MKRNYSYKKRAAQKKPNERVLWWQDQVDDLEAARFHIHEGRGILDEVYERYQGYLDRAVKARSSKPAR